MNVQHALQIAGEAIGVLTALLSLLGTVRNSLTHLGWISTEEATKTGKLLDRASLVCEKGKKGLVWVASLPGFASQPKDAPKPDLKVVPLFVAGLLALGASGCATAYTPANATTEQKLIADAQAVSAIVNDVRSKCGPEFAGLGPVIVAALQIAASPQDVLSDIMAVVQAAPTLYKDGQAVACAIKTVIDDLKALKPKPNTTAFYQLEMAQQVLALLDAQPAGVQLACAQ